MAATRDAQTVTPAGELVQELIDGVRIRAATTQLDERGSICEIYNPAWDFTDEPLVFAYQTTIRSGQTKGWVLHLEQDDRLFFSSGDVKVVLYDARPESLTFGRFNVHTFGETNRALLRIPAGVYHALQNVGERDALFVNLPTQPYRHDDPDKYRLPLDTPEIPYRF
ncbi:MAG: dTDP-4-dehydrorhamnose 3,5-epimerase family protein [Gaiellaceae bacterium]